MFINFLKSLSLSFSPEAQVNTELVKWVHSVVTDARILRCWVEELEVVLTELDHPNHNKDTDIDVVLFQEHRSNFLTHTRSLQAAVSINHRVDRHQDIN